MIRLDDDIFIARSLIVLATYAPIGGYQGEPFMRVVWRCPKGRRRVNYFHGNPDDFERALREG